MLVVQDGNLVDCWLHDFWVMKGVIVATTWANAFFTKTGYGHRYANGGHYSLLSWKRGKLHYVLPCDFKYRSILALRHIIPIEDTDRNTKIRCSTSYHYVTFQTVIDQYMKTINKK
jgi:hypothetical protein